MLSSTRRKLAMVVRARDFARAHPSADSGFAPVMTRMEAAVERGEILVLQENSGRLGERAAVSRRTQVRETMQVQQLRHLVHVADIAAKTNPALAGKFVQPPRGLPQKSFISIARVLLAQGLAQKEILIANGVGDHFFDDLTTAIASFDAATDEAHAGRLDHVGAHAELKTAVDEAGECVAILDGLYRAAYGKGSEEIGAWDSARHIDGPFRRAHAVSEAA